jgi:hypothetical protein
MHNRSLEKVLSKFKPTDHTITVKNKTSLNTFDPLKCKKF